MTAGGLQFPALLFYLAEQARVLDGKCGLGGEGLENIHDFWGKVARSFTRYSQTAKKLSLAQERNSKHGTKAGTLNRLSSSFSVLRVGQYVGNLHCGANGCGAAYYTFAQRQRLASKLLCQ